MLNICHLRYNHKLKVYLNTYDYEKMFFQYPKRKYIEFNKLKETDLRKIDIFLSNLINFYSRFALTMFKEFYKYYKNINRK